MGLYILWEIVGFINPWIYFDTDTRTFTANPVAENVGSYNIDVTATDIAGASAITNFVLTVLTVNGLEEVNSTDYYVYPNPSNGLINIYSEQGFYETNTRDWHKVTTKFEVLK